MTAICKIRFLNSTGEEKYFKMGLFLVFNLILPIWKNMCLQLMTRVELLAC